MIIHTCDQIIHDQFVHVCPGWVHLLKSVIPFLHRHFLQSLHTRPKIHFWKHGTETRFSKYFTRIQHKTSDIIVILCKCMVRILFHNSNQVNTLCRKMISYTKLIVHCLYEERDKKSLYPVTLNQKMFRKWQEENGPNSITSSKKLNNKEAQEPLCQKIKISCRHSQKKSCKQEVLELIKEVVTALAYEMGIINQRIHQLKPDNGVWISRMNFPRSC